MKNILILTISWAVSSFRPTIIPRSPFYVKATNKILNKWGNELFSVSSTTTDLEETAQRDIASMDEWASACGVERCQGFQLVATNKENEPLDVGAMTTVDLPAESPVLFVPSHIIISADQSKNEIGYIEAAENLFYKLGTIDHTPYFYLFLKLLIEYELGEESLWYPWLNSLPRYFSTGASMTHFCCQDCLPPLVGNLALSERTRFRQFFKSISYCDLISQYTKADKKLAKWAFNIVYTRGFEDGYGDVKIVPFGDYVSCIDPYLSRSREKIADSFRHNFFRRPQFNHDTNWEIQGQYDDQGNYYAYTTYDVPAGSPLRMTYTAGDSSNPSFLFARYGFLDESSPATFCKILIEPVTQELVDTGYSHERMLFYRGSGEASEEVWDVLLYKILGENNPEHQQILYVAHMNGDYDTKQALHNQYYSETLSALKSHVDGFLAELEDLSNRTVGRDRNVHPRLPIILQHNEFVKQVFLAVRENLMYK